MCGITEQNCYKIDVGGAVIRVPGSIVAANDCRKNYLDRILVKRCTSASGLIGKL
jgi:hypothetical protein